MPFFAATILSSCGDERSDDVASIAIRGATCELYANVVRFERGGIVNAERKADSIDSYAIRGDRPSAFRARGRRPESSFRE